MHKANLFTACYTCALTSEGFTCPASDVTVTRTLCLSSPSNAPPPNTSLVIQTCATCSPITISPNEPLATSPASQPSSPSQQQNPEIPPLISPVGSSDVPPINSNIPANNGQQASQAGSGYAAGTNVPPPGSSASGLISPPIHHGGAPVLRCSVLLMALSAFGAFLIL